MKKIILLFSLLALVSCSSSEDLNSPKDSPESKSIENNDEPIDYTMDNFAIDSSYSCDEGGESGDSCQNPEILNGY